MWWLFYFSIVVTLLLTAAVVLSAAVYIYEKTLEGFRLVKFIKDQWYSLSNSVENALCNAAEELAQAAVTSHNVSIYYSLGYLLEKTIREVREKTLLKKINGSWVFEGDVFNWEIRFLKYSKEGVIDWLRPTELISAASTISTIDLDLNSDVETTLKSKLPRGTRLTGAIYGVLTGNMTYSGYLDAYYTLLDKTPFRCREGSLKLHFTGRHYVTYYTNSTAESVYIYLEIYIDN